MMKWFRKHNKQLLAVFASALLVVWLGGQAFQRMFERDPQAQVIGNAHGQKLNGYGYGALKMRLGLLDRMGIPWQVPWRNPWVMSQLNMPERMQADPIMMAGARPLDPQRHGEIQWWLLDEEAKRLGVTISQDEVLRFLKQYNMTSERLTQIRDEMNVSTDDMFATVAEYLRVSYAAVLASASVQVTDPEVKDLFVRTNDQVTIRYAVLPYEAFATGKEQAPASQPVTEAELQSLFNQYKDNLAGAGKYGFGYKIPDRVSVQYVGASVEDIAKTLPPVTEDRARKYFESNKDKFQPQPPPGTQPAASQPVVKFEDVKDRVIETIRQNDASTLLKQVMEEIRASAFSEYSSSKADIDAGKVSDSLRNILEVRRNDLSTSKKLPLVYRQTGMISREEAAKEPGISSASALGNQGQPVDFATYAFNLEKAAKADQPQEDSALKVKLYQPVTVRDQAGDRLRGMYVFRVVSQEASHSPALLSDVKEQVDRDAKIMQAYKGAEAAAQKLLAAAQKEGLKTAFAAQFPALATRPVTTQPTARPVSPEVEMFEQDAISRAKAIPPYFVFYNDSLTFPTHLLGVQDTERSAPMAKTVVDAAFDLAGPTAASQPTGNRVSLVELPAQKACLVVEVVSRKAANESDFAKTKATLVGELRVQKLRDFYAGWFNPEQIEKRTDWQGKTGVID